MPQSCIGKWRSDRIRKGHLKVLSEQHSGGHDELFTLQLEVKECSGRSGNGLDHVQEDEEVELFSLFPVGRG